VSSDMSELNRRRKEKRDLINEIWVFHSESHLTSKYASLPSTPIGETLTLTLPGRLIPKTLLDPRW
jgi:hypothetical protein